MKIIVLLILSVNICWSQSVYDFSLNSTINMDGIYSDQDTLYVAEGWNGSKIFKITPDGTVSIFATGLNGPIDIVRRSNGFFYVSEWNQSRLSQISNTGVVSPYVTVSSGPGPMTMDSLENIYVTHNINNGSGFITKITPAGLVTTLVSGSLLINPGGITLDDSGNLFVANFNNGKIIKIDTASVMTEFATIPVSGTWKTGHLKYNNGNLYVSSPAGHRIFEITNLGVVTTFAGTGSAGHSSGATNAAQFSNPDGMAFLQNGSKLYVSKAFGSANYIQVIDENITSNIENKSDIHQKISVFPNPVVNTAKVVYHNPKDGFVNLSLVSTNGQVISTVVHSNQIAGLYEIEFDAKSFSENMAYLVLTTCDSIRTLKIIFD